LFDEAEKLAKRELAPGRTNVRAPITGFFYDSWSDEQTERAKHLACAALAACARFKKDFPNWPELPVHRDVLDQLPDALSARMWLLHEFACSQRYYEWNPRHPTLPPYACSVMAFKYAPDKIREDDDLKREFPPQKLIELTGPGRMGALYWLFPEMIARDEALERFHRRLESPDVDPAVARAAYRRELAVIGTG
jgi:hypothetical protein